MMAERLYRTLTEATLASIRCQMAGHWTMPEPSGLIYDFTWRVCGPHNLLYGDQQCATDAKPVSK